MKKIFSGSQHYVVLALHKGGVSFPATKKDILAKSGKIPVRVDWDSYISLSECIKDVKLEKFDNKSQFFCAWLGTITKL